MSRSASGAGCCARGGVAGSSTAAIIVNARARAFPMDERLQKVGRSIIPEFSRRRDGKLKVQKGLTLRLGGPRIEAVRRAHFLCGGDTASTGVKTRGMHAEPH